MPSDVAVLRAALRSNPEHHAKLRELCESGAVGPMVDIPDDEPIIVVAAPEHFGIEGAKQARCTCGLIVWLSPSTQAMMLKRVGIPALVRCAWCFMRELRKNGETTLATQRPQ
jgi:hypothetical protein